MQRQDNYMEPDKVVVKSTPIDDDDGNEPEDLAGRDKDDKNMSKDRISGDYRSRFSISHSSQTSGSGRAWQATSEKCLSRTTQKMLAGMVMMTRKCGECTSCALLLQSQHFARTMMNQTTSWKYLRAQLAK